MNGLDVNNIWSIPVGFAILIIIVVTMGAVAFAVLFLFFKKKQG